MRSSGFIAGGLLGFQFLASPVAAQSERSPSFEWKQCDEDVLGMRVDPGPVQEAVGSEHTIALEDGKAMVAIMIQDCSQYWIDGTDLGPNQMIHVLARIEGPDDVRPVVGAHSTEPTMSWFGLFTGSTNPSDREARMASGTAPERIEAVSLDSHGLPRGGHVTVGPDASFSWSIPSAPQSARLMGVNHDIYVKDDDGRIILKRVQAIGNLVAVPSPGTLEVEGAVGLGGVIGPGRHPVMVYMLFPIWARAILGEVPAGRR